MTNSSATPTDATTVATLDNKPTAWPTQKVLYGGVAGTTAGALASLGVYWLAKRYFNGELPVEVQGAMLTAGLGILGPLVGLFGSVFAYFVPHAPNEGSVTSVPSPPVVVAASAPAPTGLQPPPAGPIPS